MQHLKNTIEQLQKNFLDYKTETLVFRPFVKPDCFALYTATKNPEFSAKLLWDINTHEELMVECQKLIREHDLKQSVVMSVCEKDTGKWAGLVKFSIYKDSITMSLWSHPDYWKSRAPIRCAESAIEIAFANSDLPHIYALIINDNLTMQKMVLSNNFEQIGETTAPHSKGHLIPLNVYKLERDAWIRKTKVVSY